MSKKATIFSLAISAFALVSCQDKPVNEHSNTQITEIKGFALPEGACGDSNFAYISNVGEHFKPLEKDGDGFISKLDHTGKIVALKYLPKDDTLHSPKGMSIVNNILYVTDIDRIFGFDLRTEKTVFKLDFSKEKTLLLNDLVDKDDHTLFVSAMDIGKIYEVNLDSNQYHMVLELPKPNGLHWSAADNTLYIGQFGREDNSNGNKGDIGKLSFNEKGAHFETITSHQGNIDGVSIIDGKLYFTNWLSKKEKGSLHYIDLKNPNDVKEVRDLNIDGPGDFYFHEQTQTFWVPKMKENTVIIFKK